MGKKRYQEEISILEAVDNLSTMAEIDLLEGKTHRQGLFDKLRQHAKWLSFTDKKKTDDRIKLTFSTIHRYLEHVNAKSIDELKRNHLQNGVIAIMGLAREAALKVDGLKKLMHPGEKTKSVTQTNEYQLLESFYKRHVQTKLQNLLDTTSSVKTESPEASGIIKDLDSLKKDEEYELLFIKRDDGEPFFTSDLIDHLKLVTDFDIAVLDYIQDTPLQMVRVIQDDEAWTVASEIYIYAKSVIEPFLKSYKTHLDDQISHILYSAVIALVAAKNPQNLLKSQRKKSCLGYFKDFHYYLREVVNHQAFSILDQSPYHLKVKAVIQKLCGWFFLHPMSHPKAVENLKKLIHQGQIKSIKRHSIWEWFLESYEHIANELTNSPSGPILKLIDQYERGEFDNGFSSIWQSNYPSKILDFNLNGKRPAILYLPSPTIQKVATHANLIGEFQAFLNLNPNQQFLLINLQDKSLIAKPRAEALEEAYKHFPNLSVLSLPKDSHFYHQDHEFFDLHKANYFLKALEDQIHGAPITGFTFPTQISHAEIIKFSQKMIPWIHHQFFANNSTLTRKNRQDFIEIFYGFIVFKIIEKLSPDYISMTCKDALDVGSLGNLQLFAFLKIFMEDPTWGSEERDRILELALVPAFINRSRLVLLSRFDRMISMLRVLESTNQLPTKAMHELHALFPKLKISDLHFFEDEL